MKARRVRKLDPKAPLADNAERIVRVRLDELCAFAPAALDPERRRTLHDMRIAAKRLRYILELTSPCFGPYAARAAKHARDLQDQIGEIHDCDELIPLVLDQIAALRGADAQTLVEHAESDHEITLGEADRVPNRAVYRPLELLVVQQQARRAQRFEQFVASWTALEHAGFRTRLEKAISQRPQEPGPEAAPAPEAEPAPEAAPGDAAALDALGSAAILKQAVAG
jgi:CHAD domain